MVELSEDIKNSVFKLYFWVTLVLGFVIVTPLTLWYDYMLQGTSFVRTARFIILMITIPVAVIVPNFMFKTMFPLKLKFKQKSLEVVHKNEARAFSIFYKDIESAVFYDDIMGVNACKFVLKEGKPKFINQVGKEIIQKLRETFDNYKIPYETKKRGRQPVNNR